MESCLFHTGLLNEPETLVQRGIAKVADVAGLVAAGVGGWAVGEVAERGIGRRNPWRIVVPHVTGEQVVGESVALQTPADIEETDAMGAVKPFVP